MPDEPHHHHTSLIAYGTRHEIEDARGWAMRLYINGDGDLSPPFYVPSYEAWHGHGGSAPPDPRIDVLISLVQTLIGKIDAMSGSLNDRLAALTETVNRTVGVDASILAFIQGVPALVKSAVDEAIAAGAPPETLAAFDNLNTQLSAKTDELQAAIANTPNEPAPTPAEPVAQDPIPEQPAGGFTPAP